MVLELYVRELLGNIYFHSLTAHRRCHENNLKSLPRSWKNGANTACSEIRVVPLPSLPVFLPNARSSLPSLLLHHKVFPNQSFYHIYTVLLLLAELAWCFCLLFCIFSFLGLCVMLFFFWCC